MSVSLANILIRQANKTENPRAYLDNLATAKLEMLNGQSGVIISTSVNGKSVQLAVPSGTGPQDIMEAAAQALSWLEVGIPRVSRRTLAIFR